MDAPFYHRQKSKWSLDDRCDQILRKFHALKYSFSLIVEQIALQTGIKFTRNALIGRARRIGLPHGEPKKVKERPLGRRASYLYRKPSQRGANSALAQRINRRKAPDFEVTPWVPQPEVAFIGKPLLDLEPNQCRYPQGDGPFTFCGQTQAEGSSYCEFHARLCSIGRPAPKPRAWIAARQP